jgi:hypothetical protein
LCFHIQPNPCLKMRPTRRKWLLLVMSVGTISENYETWNFQLSVFFYETFFM